MTGSMTQKQKTITRRTKYLTSSFPSNNLLPILSLPFDPPALAHAPVHNPSVRVPSKHEVLDTQVKPETAVFVHDDPDGNAAVQSPTVSAFRSRFDASQFAKRRMCKIGS